MKEKLVIVNQSGAYMDIDVANVAAEKYERVVMLGNFKVFERHADESIGYDRLVRYDRSSSIRRMWTWSVGALQVFWKLLARYRGWEILYYTNPPMACWASLVLSNKFSIMEYDIYPDALKTIGIGERNIIYKVWGWLNRRILTKAENVFTLSEGMGECLTKYCAQEKIKVIPVWTASSNFKPVCKENNPFLKEHGLKDWFIVMYSGNIGYTHSVEVLVEVAKQMKDVADVQFVIIGEGKKKEMIRSEVEKSDLQNVTLLPYQSVDVLPFSLGAADLGVITLDENVAQVSVPSKTFNMMAAGAPLLVISNEETEIYKLVSKYRNGRCIPKNRVHDMVEYIMEVKSNALLKKQYSDNSLNASKDFTYANAEMYFE